MPLTEALTKAACSTEWRDVARIWCERARN